MKTLLAILAIVLPLIVYLAILVHQSMQAVIASMGGVI